MRSHHLILLLAIWGLLVTGFVSTVVILGGEPVPRAVISMALGLVLIWIILGGSVMRLGRERIRTFVLRVPMNWRVRFVLFATLLALIEEAVTTTMTNLAPLLGVEMGQAYITASGNYLDVVALHSVVVFVPMFIAWAWMLGRWDFWPNQVFLLFGLTGTLAEISFGGPQTLINIGFWTFVYGLMVYLPAYSLPPRPNLRRPRVWHYAIAVLLPFLATAPVAGVVSWLHPIKIHFPPIQT